jgi:hypothetical protein
MMQVKSNPWPQGNTVARVENWSLQMEHWLSGKSVVAD